LEIEVLQEAESVGISENHPIAQTLSRSIETTKGKPPKFELCPGL
jgi:hypothetical protein